MAISATCCLNLPPPSHGLAPSSNLKPPSQVSLPGNDDKWRRRCVLGMACVIVGLQTGNLEVNGATANANAVSVDFSLAIESKQTVARWSDKRACPPWRPNSLENIVPENLPRPSARRRWEAVRYHEGAPTVEGTRVKATSNNACFSL